jgi:hypothetical protein
MGHRIQRLDDAGDLDLPVDHLAAHQAADVHREARPVGQGMGALGRLRRAAGGDRDRGPGRLARRQRLVEHQVDMGLEQPPGPELQDCRMHHALTPARSSP